MAILFTVRVFAREEFVEEILFIFHFDVWPGTQILALRLIGQQEI